MQHIRRVSRGGGLSVKYNNRDCNMFITWWRHQMETFSALLTLCAGNSPVTGEFPSQRPVTQSFDVFFDLRLDERASWRLKSNVTQLFVESCLPPLCLLQKNLKLSITLHSWKESTDNYFMCITKGKQCGKPFPVMTLSWYTIKYLASDPRNHQN